MEINIKINHKKIINPVYLLHFLDYSRRKEIYFGSAGSGKSHFVVQKMIYKYLKNPGRRCLVVRKVKGTIRESIFQLFKDILVDWKIISFCNIRESYLNIKLPNGSEFIFCGLDDVEKVKSITRISDVIVEEATEITSDEYNQLNLRMRAKTKYNQIIIMYNPVSPQNWVFEEFHKYPLDSKIFMLLKTTYKDNKFLDQEYVNSIEQMTGIYWEIYGLGNFCGGERTGFPEFNKEIHVCTPFEIPIYWKKWVSIDNGYTDPFAVYWFALGEDGIVYVYREYTRTKEEEKILYSEQAKGIIFRTKQEKIITNVVGHDAYSVNLQGAGNTKTLISYYNEGGLYNFTKACTDRKLGKTTVHEYLKNNKIKIFDTCTQLIETLPLLLTEEKNSEVIEDCKIDHWYDSLRYGLLYCHSLKSMAGNNIEEAKKLSSILEERSKLQRQRIRMGR